MDENKMNDFEEEEDLVYFEDEDGNEYTYSVVDYLFYNGEEYALLAEVNGEETNDDEDDEEGEACIVCKVVTETDEDGEDTETFELVDDELGRKLVDIFNTKMQEEEEE